MAKVIEIPYAPRPWTKELHETDKRWSIIVAHRRSGKTTATVNHLQRDCLIRGDALFGYIAPTYKQAKAIAWDLLKKYSVVVPGVVYNETELTVKYPNNSKLRLFGADNPDTLRGLGFNGVVFDEYSQQPPNIFSEIIRPALADTGGYGIWIGTPKGHNDFWRLYNRAKKDADWFALFLTVDDTGVLSKEELADARKSMSEDEYNQEFYCSFEAAIKGAYYADQLSRARSEGRITNVPKDEGQPVYTFWDLGVSDSTAIIFMQKAGLEWHIIDYYETHGEGLAHYADVLKEKGYIYAEHYGPHDLSVRELGSGKSRIEMAKQLGIDFRIVPNLPVDDGINAVRTRFNTLWIDEEGASKLVDALTVYRKEWDDKMGEFKRRPLHDWSSHAADALRYWAVSDVATRTGVKVFKPHWSGYNRISSQ